MDKNTEILVEILKQHPMDYPKGLYGFIYTQTDFRTNKTLKVARYVETIFDFNGVLIKRVFAFKSKTKNKSVADIQVTEVFRKVEGQKGCLLRNIWSNMSGKHVEFREGDEYHFYQNDIEYTFSNIYSMYDQQDIIDRYDMKYCQWFSEKNKSGMDFFNYICAYRAQPKIELLVKAGLSQYVHCYKKLKFNEKSLDKIFGINNYWVPYLKNMDYSDIMLIKSKKLGIKTWDDLKFIREHQYVISKTWNRTLYKVRNVKMYHYILNSTKSNNRNNFVYMYEDYISFCIQLGFDISKDAVLFPKNLKEKHDQYMHLMDVKKNEDLIKNFLQAYLRNIDYVYSSNGYVIIPCETYEQIVEEGETLHHCVKTYSDKYQKGETNIFFIRNITSVTEPFVTLELKEKKVVQCRANRNNKPIDEVVTFVNDWCKNYNLNSCFIREAV